MKAYGGFIMAHRGGKTATRSLVTGAPDFPAALMYARDAAHTKFPTSKGYTNHFYDIVELQGKILVDAKEEPDDSVRFLGL